jgi:hypothetical protein
MTALPEDELTEWLTSGDARTLTERVERLRFVREQYDREHGLLLQGGLISARAFEEMQFSYVNGAYLSCVLAAQVVLEHELTGLLDWIEKYDLDGTGFLRLCEAALSEEIITQQEFAEFDRLRKVRNPYTHSKAFMGRSCIIRRSAENCCAPEDLFKADAEMALRTVIRLFSRPPFALG